MLDFTSSLYLDRRHPSSDLASWSALTTGRPAILGRPARSRAVALALAGRLGCASAVLARSALHGLSDCFEVLLGRVGTLVVDAGAYPTVQWAAQRSAGQGHRVVTAAHHDPDHARRLLAGPGAGRSVVVADGWCIGCARPFPLVEMLTQVERYGAMLILEDTQPIGLLGAGADVEHPFGRGGGGTARRAAVTSDHLVVVASLAKSWGAPLTVVAGPTAVVEQVAMTGSAVHSSPPTSADIVAAAAALTADERDGDARRRRLAALIRALQARTAATGLVAQGGLFPIQSTPPTDPLTARRIAAGLSDAGIRGVLRMSGHGQQAVVSLVVTTAHSSADIDRAAAVLAESWRHGGGGRHACA